MQVGDLVGIGWNGLLKRPFYAIVTEVHEPWHGGDVEDQVIVVRVLETGSEQWACRKDLREIKNEVQDR